MTAPDFENRPLRSLPSAFLSAKLPVALIALTGLGFSPFSYGDFALNFSGTTSTTVVQGNQANTIGGQTPFTAVNTAQAGELVVDPNTGINYWHYLMGDPSSGFAQEVYIQAGGTFNSTTSSCNQLTICSASGGNVVGAAPNFNILGSNSVLTGNGTGNPNRVLVRQILGGTWDATTSTWTCDTDYCSEFLKSAYADKPKITQGINESDFSSTFILDMSGVAMGNNTTDLNIISKGSTPTGASLTNAQTVKDPSTGGVVSSFDMATDSQNTFVTGGKYTYVEGTTRGTVLGASGHYVYVDGGYDLSNVDYSPFLDKNDPSNIWTNPTFKPQ